MLKRPLKEYSRSSYPPLGPPHMFSERSFCKDAILDPGSLGGDKTGKVHIPVEETANANEGPELRMQMHGSSQSCLWLNPSEAEKRLWRSGQAGGGVPVAWEGQP